MAFRFFLFDSQVNKPYMNVRAQYTGRKIPMLIIRCFLIKHICTMYIKSISRIYSFSCLITRFFFVGQFGQTLTILCDIFHLLLRMFSSIQNLEHFIMIFADMCHNQDTKNMKHQRKVYHFEYSI